MRRDVAGSTLCRRVQAQIDEALATGELALAPHLADHAARCPRCGPDVQDVQRLFSRLRGSAAAVDTGPALTATRQVVAEAQALARQQAAGHRPVTWGWFLGQVAVLIALLVGLTLPVAWGIWRARTVAADHPPQPPAAQWAETFSSWVRTGLDYLFGDVRK